MSGRAALLIGLVLVAAPAAPAERVLRIRVTHSFRIEDAKARMEMMLKYWHERVGATYEWNGNVAQVSGKAFGISLVGKLTVERDFVEAISSDPGPLFRSIGSRYVEKKMKKYLHPDYLEP